MIVRAKAPVRISFGTCGDSDYYIDFLGWGNGINATIDVYSHCEVHEIEGKRIVLRSLETGHVESFDSANSIDTTERELNLMKAVVKHYAAMYGLKGLEIITHTDAPLESGLGGSAAHTVAMIRAMNDVYSVDMTTEDVARLAYYIERTVVGVEGGYQDQWAAAYGGMNYMRFTKGVVEVTPIKTTGRELELLEDNILLFYVPRVKEGSILHEQQRKRAKDSVALLNMKRDNVTRLKQSIEKRSFDDIGGILHLDWKLKKQTAPDISNEKINQIYDAAIAAGALGGRFIGAGAGGSAIFFCPKNKESVISAMEKFGAQQIRYKFERKHEPKDYKNDIKQRISEHNFVIEKVLKNDALMNDIHNLTNKIVESYKSDGKLVIFGNGGSASDAQHIAAELVNYFKFDRPMLNAIALNVNTSIMTAIANDSSYDNVFSRQIESLVDSRDVVIGISTSGKAVNVLNGLKKAKERGATVAYFTGHNGGMISRECNGAIDISINIPYDKTDRIQEAHIMVGHIICELVESSLFGS